MTFTGFPREATKFFTALAKDNTKQFWDENKATYEEKVRGPMRALLAELPGAWKTFRPNRDIRFSKDKSPYKTNISARSSGRVTRYVELSVDGVFAASGMYMMMPDQLGRFRDAIADEPGVALVKILAALEKKKITISVGAEPPLKTAPRGFDADHPRVELLRRKGLAATIELPASSKALVEELLAFWKSTAPLDAWLARHVGPTTAEHM